MYQADGARGTAHVCLLRFEGQETFVSTECPVHVKRMYV